MKLVLNKYIRGVGLTVNDVEATLSMPVTTVIPLENQLAISSMNQGIPFVAGMRRAKVSRVSIIWPAEICYGRRQGMNLNDRLIRIQRSGERLEDISSQQAPKTG